MSLVPVQCWMRTFKADFAGGAASCFVVTHRDRQWLITAKHVADAAARLGAAALSLSGENGLDIAVSTQMRRVVVAEGPDVAVFSLGDNKIVRDDLTLLPSSDGVVLSQEVFFLGYPLPGSLPLSGRLPAVRKGIVSQRAAFDGVVAWIIDGHNLPGFSGGPLVFADHGGLGSAWQILGVVSAYVRHPIAVEIAGGALTSNSGVTVPSNAGLVVVYDIKHAVDAIDAFIDAGH
jgi:hypothetical protein